MQSQQQDFVFWLICSLLQLRKDSKVVYESVLL